MFGRVDVRENGANRNWILNLKIPNRNRKGIET